MRISFILLLAILFAGCDKPSSPVTNSVATSNPPVPRADPPRYPALIVDEAHNAKTTNAPEIYKFTATPGLELETSTYQFNFETNRVVAPDIIAICLNSADLNTNSFKRKFPTLTKTCVIDRNTLDPVRGDLFPGFHTGDRGVFIIGHVNRVIGNTRELEVAWAAAFEVQ